MKLGLCTSNSALSQQIKKYCQKSCGLCPGANSLTCANLNKTCNSGICQSDSYLMNTSIKCKCPPNTAGAYCQRRKGSFNSLFKTYNIYIWNKKSQRLQQFAMSKWCHMRLFRWRGHFIHLYLSKWMQRSKMFKLFNSKT